MVARRGRSILGHPSRWQSLADREETPLKRHHAGSNAQGLDQVGRQQLQMEAAPSHPLPPNHAGASRATLGDDELATKGKTLRGRVRRQSRELASNGLKPFHAERRRLL